MTAVNAARRGATPLTSRLELLVNPFPILPMHFTLPMLNHQPQRIRTLYPEMLSLIEEYSGLTVFYNGPKAGASAPDHAHLQAGTSGILPLQREWQRLTRNMKVVLNEAPDALLAVVEDYPCAALLIRSKERKASERLFCRLHFAMEDTFGSGEDEPMMNLVAWMDGGNYNTVVFPRAKHRPDRYYKEGEEQMMVSPGALDMAGLIVTPRQEDFSRIDGDTATAILSECSISGDELDSLVEKLCTEEKTDAGGEEKPASRKTAKGDATPSVTVGIVSAQRIDFCLNGLYQAKGESIEGQQTVELTEGGLTWRGQQYRELRFNPVVTAGQQLPTDDSTFTLCDVTIGQGFHWERRRNQTFFGTLRLIVEADKVLAINEVPVERYLESVISSEMSATSSLELLKAHAVISRSWLLYQKQRREENNDKRGNSFFSFVKKDDELLRWYDREEHTLFDVCADDHCQRYQGVAALTGKGVTLPQQAVRETRGQVITYGEEICDARFSKCCGGRTEEFQYCWDDTVKPYLQSVECQYCNTDDKDMLRQVLNDYDLETTDFHDWRVEYTCQQLTELVNRKLKMDLGDIQELVPLDRGKSGRIWRLKIVGTKRSFTIGKELEIRRTLSETHLYSSCFDVEKTADGRFVLKGRGWGHGVGLCQIGAAVMGHQGMDYRSILLHYYKGAEIKQIY
jgi:SpoIID/LytB domain protein